MNSTINSLQLVSSILTLIGGYFLCKSFLGVKAKDFVLQTKTYIGGNNYLLKALIDQNADAVVGFGLTFTGGATALISVFITLLLDLKFSLILGTALLIAVTIISTVWSKKIAETKLKSARLHSYALYVDEYIPDWDPDRFKPEKVIESISDFQIAKFDLKNADPIDRILHLLSLCNAQSTFQKIKKFKDSRNK